MDEVRSARGKVEAHTVRINVTTTPPTDAKPREDTEL
jgi:hypothetical protein